MTLAITAVSRTSARPNLNVAVTSASFTPANNSLLVVSINGDSATGIAQTFSVTDSLSTHLTWTKRAQQDGGNATGAAAAIYTAPVATGAAMTITVERTASENNAEISFSIVYVTGHDTVSPIGGNAAGNTTTNNATISGVTTTVPGSVLLACGVDWSAAGVFTSSDLTIDTATFTGLISVVSGFKITGAAGAQTANLNAGGTAAVNTNWVMLVVNALAGTTYDVTPSDAATLADTAAGAGDFPRSVSDSTTAADAAGGAVDRTSTGSDSTTVADAAAGGIDRTSTLSDSATFTATAAAGLDLTLAGTETLTVAAAAAGGLTVNPTLADAATVADTGAGNIDRVSILADTATLSDAAGGGFDITIAASAALTLADAGSAGVDAAATAGTGVTLGDSGGAAMDASGTFSDTITVADTAASQGNFLSSLADALTLSDAAAGEVSSGAGDPVSIRERIERVVRTRVATIYGVGRAFRWDMRGVIDPATGLAVGSDGQALLQRVGDALVLGLDENKLSGQGTAVTVLELALQVQVKMGQDADETVTTSELLNRWLLRIERAVMANPEMWEGGTDGAGVRLAVDTIVSHTRQGTSNGSVRGGGEAIAAVDFVIEYQHFRNDPYAGPSITRVSLPAIDEFAAAGTPDPEDDTLSIKERIEQLIQATVAAVDGVGRVFRWDMRGLRDPGTGLGVDADGLEMIARGGDALVLSLDESAEEGAQGSTGMTIKTLGARVEAKSSQDADLQQTTEAAHTSWLAKFESALLANPRLLDGQGALLAIDVRVTQTHEPPREAGQVEAISAIDFEIEYEHYRNDPAAGPGVVHLVEA